MAAKAGGKQFICKLANTFNLMKKALACLLMLLCFSKSIYSQTFQKTFGTTGDDYATDVVQTSDKGYAVLGVLNSGGVYLLKTDSLGSKQWSQKFLLESPSPYQSRTFAQTADGGFVLSGSISYSNTHYSFVVKTDALGNVMWSKMHVALSRILSIKQTIEGDYIAVGSQYFGGNSALVRFNASGDILWSRTMPVANNAVDVVQLSSDSSFIAYYYYYNSSQNLMMARFSKNAQLMWSKIVTNPIFASTGHGHLYENGGDVQVALTGSGSYCPGVLSMRKDGSGARMTGLACLNSYTLFDACPAANKGAFLVGQFRSASAQYGRDIVLALVDSLGTLQWARQIGGANDEVPLSIKQTKDKGLVIAGSTKSFSSGLNDIYLVKTDSLGQSGCHTTAISFSVTTDTVSLNNYTGAIDSLFNNVTSVQSPTVSTPSEINYDACVCVPPVAGFLSQPDGVMNDMSTWAEKWYWTCSGVAGIDSTTINKSYYGLPSGTYTVCLKVKNSCGVDSLCQPFTYTFFPIYVEENTESIAISAYPNPFQDRLVISREGSGANASAIEVRVINSLGSLVYVDKMQGAQKEVQLTGLAPGLYFIQFVSDGRVLSRKLIKE